MAGELTAADVSWRARREALLQDALRGAVVTDSRVSVSDDGSVKIAYLDARRPDGRVVISEQGFSLSTDPGKNCSGDDRVMISVVPAPHFCPHKDDDGCPGSDCCEVGDRCLRAAARGRC